MRRVKRTNWNSGNIGLDFRTGPTELDLSPYSIFVGSIRSPETRKKYIQRLGYFFDYLDIDQRNVEVCFEILARKARADINWFGNATFKYLQVHKGRVDPKEISSATFRNNVKSIRLFCEQMDILIPWKKLMRGMPKGRRYSNDRAPTLQEIKNMLAYPDRRKRPLLYSDYF
jgi:hypothetical protein